jgi:hypothetical protein
MCNSGVILDETSRPDLLAPQLRQAPSDALGQSCQYLRGSKTGQTRCKTCRNSNSKGYLTPDSRWHGPSSCAVTPMLIPFHHITMIKVSGGVPVEIVHAPPSPFMIPLWSRLVGPLSLSFFSLPSPLATFGSRPCKCST